MGKKRSFKIGEQIVDIPEAEVGQFLSDVPDAKEVQSFVIGKGTVDIPVAEVETFKADVPEAKPLFEQEPPEQGDTIPIPVVPTRNPLNPPQQDPEGPELPSVSMDEQGNMSRTVEMQRKQRDAILNSAFKVPEDIRSNPVFGKRYVMDVSRKTGIPENAVKQVYEQGERDYQEYNKLKADFDIGKGTDEDLNKMGGLLLNLGRYDEAIQAYKTLEGRLMQMGIKEYQPGMRQDYIDQRQAPAFIGILNAVYAKGDMKEYERLLKIADVKGLDFVKEYKQAIEESQNNGTPLDLRLSGLPSVGTGTSAQPGNEMTYDNSGQMVPVGTPEYRRTFENSKEADYINSIADAVGSLTGLPQTVEMTTHGAEKVGKSFQNQFGNPWKFKGVGETVSNYLGMLTGAVETVLAPAAFLTPEGAGVAVTLPQLPPKVQEYLMPVSKIVRDAYDGKPPANAENLAIFGDILTLAVLHVGATGVKEYVTSGGMGRDVVSAKLTSQLLLNKIKEIPPEQVREMVTEAEKRFEATGGDQKAYTELVRDRAQGAVDELKAIEHSAEPEPYNPEPAPESLRTVPEGADVEYEGKKGTLDRGDDGTWYFTDDEGKSTQIPVEDKYNPQEKLSELGIQVLPEVSKEAVARAVADAEQVGEVEYKGKKYFVSLDNPMKENPTGDLVFERTSDGRMLNRFDSHPDPTFAQNRKLAIVNKFLEDKGLPPREGLIEPWKEAPVKEAPAPVSAEPVTEGAVTPEVAEPVTPKENADQVTSPVSVPATEASGDIQAVAEGSPEKLQKPAKEKKPLTPAQEHKQKVKQAKTMAPSDFRHAVLQFMLRKGKGLSMSDMVHDTGLTAKDFPAFTVSKTGHSMHSVWEAMKSDPETAHLIPENDADFRNQFWDIMTEYGDRKQMWADLVSYADEAQWRDMGFNSKHEYESYLAYKMESEAAGVNFDEIPDKLIEDVEREVDAMPDEAVEQMLKDLDENAPQEVYEERTNNGPEEVVAESETGSPKGEDLNEIAKEQQKRDADKAVEQELAKAKKELEQAKTTLESKRKQVDERIAQEQQQEMFAEPKAENPLEGDFEAGARADALKAELNAYEAAQKKYAELRGKQKAEVMKKIDDFEQWVLNLPGIKDMSGGAEKAGIGAAEIVKGMAEAVRKAVEAGFDIADALHDAIEKYKKLSPEFFAAVSEKDIRDRFGVKEEAFAASNAASKKMREELGIPQDAEFTAQNRRDVEAVMAGAKNLKERSVNPKDLVDKVIWENHMLNAEEQQFLVQHEIDLFNERKGLEKKLDALLSKEVDPKQYMLKSVMPAADEFTTIQQRVDQIRSEQAQVLAALEKAGSEQSLVFRMRQLINRRDYSVENSIRTYMALFGREPSQRAKEFFAAKEREIAQIEEQRTALADKAKEAELQGIIDGLREELAREKTRNEGKPVLTQKEIQRKKELKQKFAGVFNDVTNIAAALADKEFYEYAGIIFKETVGDVKNFTKRLIDELGPKVAPHAQEIFDRVKKSQYEEPEYRNNRLWIDPNMLREIVREGVENHTELSQRVYDIVKDTYPDVTMREVQESISGYGKTINPKLSELDRELNSLKRDMRLAVSLEDAKAGRGVKRSGYQPAPLTDSQREMMRTIREELKNYPQDEAAVEKKWKTALDKVKTGLRNAITDAEKRLEDLRAGRAVESRERKQIELDETAIQLKEQLADLKKQLKDIEGEKVKTPEQIVREAVSALEKSEGEYQDRINEIRTTGTYTPKVKRQVSDPAIDAARLARDLAKDEFERALETTDYPRQAAASKALSAAEAKLRALEDKIAAGDVSFRKRIMSLVDTENPLLKATKEQIKIKQDMIKAMREASGEADRHAVELWKARKQRRIDELNTKKANKDFTTKAQRELPIDEEMKRLAAAATRAKFEYDVAFELAKMENMSKVDKLKELGYDLYEFPKSIMASMDLSAVMRQGGILSARHPIQTITNTIPKMLKMFAKESFHKEWYDNLVHSDDYISAKESGLFLNEPNAKITAREEQAASRIAAAIPGVGASNRAYSGFLNMQRMQAFSDFKNACINAGVKGDMLRAELRNYADFINKATGRGSFGRLETSVPILNTLFFAPRFAISRFQLLTKTLTGFYNTPKARIEAYKAMGSWAAAIGSTVALFKMAGYEVDTDMNSSDFLKVKRGNQTYDPWAGMQQPFVLLARTLMGSSKSVRGEEKELNKGGTTYKDVWERYLRSKAAPIPGMIYDAAKGKTMDNQPFKWIPESGEDITEGRGIASLIMPMIIQETIKEGKTDGIPTAVMNLLPNMVGIGVQTIYLNELKDKSKLEPDVRKLMDQSGFYPNQSNDTEVYVDDKPYEISADELTKIRELRLQKAGEIINRWYGKGKFDGLTKTEIHALFKKAYNRADGEAKDELLPEGWTNKKPKPEEEVFEVK